MFDKLFSNSDYDLATQKERNEKIKAFKLKYRMGDYLC